MGESVTRYEPGDAVFGDLNQSGWGGYAEYVCAGQNFLEPKPEGLTFEQAAVVPQGGVMALQGIRDYGNAGPGDKAVINGAGGAVETFAIQIAKYFGAEVTAVDTTAKLDKLREIGADHVIDFIAEDFTRAGKRSISSSTSVGSDRSLINAAHWPRGANVFRSAARRRAFFRRF